VTLVKESIFYSEKQLEPLDRTKIPHHVAIIPDGNRRWAKSCAKEPHEGYREGAEVLITTVKAAKELGIKVLTAFSFSTENWLRPQNEIRPLLSLIAEYLKRCQAMMCDMQVRLSVIGDIEKMPKALIDIIEETKQATSHCKEMELVLALNYGSRDEIKRAVKKVLKDCLEKGKSPDKVTEEDINCSLDTSSWPDPDLVIRTSGEKRVSNFLLWQSSYAEIYIDDTNWPNFTPQHLLKAVLDYQQRERRRGGG